MTAELGIEQPSVLAARRAADAAILAEFLEDQGVFGPYRVTQRQDQLYVHGQTEDGKPTRLDIDMNTTEETAA